MTTTIFGEEKPIFDPTNLQQTYGDSCAIKSQQMILETFGKQVSEDQLIDEATKLNIYTPGEGTPIAHMGDLLEVHGVESTLFESANKYTLMHELAQGHQVVVAVDSGELWEPGFKEEIMDTLFGETPDHAVIVTGIDTTNPDAIEVILSDPGTGEVMRYPYEQFADAWSDSSFTMIATNDSPEELENGILDSIMGMDSQQWMEQFSHMIDSGLEVAQTLMTYLEENPEIVSVAMDIIPMALMNNHEGSMDSSLDTQSNMVDIG